MKIILNVELILLAILLAKNPLALINVLAFVKEVAFVRKDMLKIYLETVSQ